MRGAGLLLMRPFSSSGRWGNLSLNVGKLCFRMLGKFVTGSFPSRKLTVVKLLFYLRLNFLVHNLIYAFVLVLLPEKPFFHVWAC